MFRFVHFKSVVAAVAAVVSLHSAAGAQIIYEPVRYQYPVGSDRVMYYGGSNPRVFEYARRLEALYGQPRAYDWKGRELTTVRRGLTTAAPYVFTDVAPYVNASLYGYTATDARNEAYANVPTYYRKRDLLRAAVPAGDGTWVVPAQARSLDRPVRTAAPAGVGPTTRPLPKPRAIIIIPKNRPAARPQAKPRTVIRIDGPAKTSDNPSVAAAR